MSSHFDSFADKYRVYRPSYPAELFDWLVSLMPERTLALDVGCGNGQCAVALAERFAQVVATDISAEQISHAMPKANVTYRVAAAHETGLADNTVDLLTAATAAHWFAQDKFHAEARRALKRGGVVALWSYYLPEIAPEIDPIVERLYHDILLPYWAPEIDYQKVKYRTLPFPFTEIPHPDFTAEARWNLEETLGFFRTFSGRIPYMKDHDNIDPVSIIEEDLRAVWPDGKSLTARFPLFMRIGRV